MDDLIALCGSAALVERSCAVPFDVVFAGQTCRAFAVRFDGQAHAYLNRCTHVGMALDRRPNQVFDATAQWLLCASHSAAYAPATGACAAGPCRQGLVKITLSEKDGVVYWHCAYNLHPAVF